MPANQHLPPQWDNQLHRLSAIVDDEAHNLPSVGNGGGGGMDGRIDKIEADVSALKIDVAVIKASMATKDDLHAQTNRFISWMLGAVALTSLLAGIVMYLVQLAARAI